MQRLQQHTSMASDPEQAQPLVNGGDDASSADEHEHYSHRAPWLRAFVLGATDGLVSDQVHWSTPHLAHCVAHSDPTRIFT